MKMALRPIFYCKPLASGATGLTIGRFLPAVSSEKKMHQSTTPAVSAAVLLTACCNAALAQDFDFEVVAVEGQTQVGGVTLTNTSLPTLAPGGNLAFTSRGAADLLLLDTGTGPAEVARVGDTLDFGGTTFTFTRFANPVPDVQGGVTVEADLSSPGGSDDALIRFDAAGTPRVLALTGQPVVPGGRDVTSLIRPGLRTNAAGDATFRPFLNPPPSFNGASNAFLVPTDPKEGREVAGRHSRAALAQV